MSLAGLDISGLSKSFGGIPALADARFAVAGGTILALLGQNGSGKSTLVKCLTGVYTPDAGEVSIFGRSLHFPATSPHSHGIAVIHQDLGLVESMTVIENLGVSASYGARLFGFINERGERARFRAIMQQMGIQVPLDALISELAPAERALIAIVRAIRLMEDSGRPIHEQVFILDEPTATLSGPEAQRVLDLMARMRENGAAVVFISHRLGEVMRVADSVAVLRAGRLVHTGALDGVTRTELVDLMLGRTLSESFPEPDAVSSDETLLDITDLTTDRLQISLSVKSTEIVGVTGLAGMGQEDLPRAIFGDLHREGGEVRVGGRPLAHLSPSDAIGAGVALVPSDRHRDGCWTDGSAGENLTLTRLGPLLRRGLLSRPAEHDYAQKTLSDFDVRPPDPNLPMTGFSGGNQQKVVFAKWMQLDPRVLVLDEPTQGVDPGAAHDLLVRVVEAARNGAAVVIVSGDLEQIVRVCHRVVVVDSGRVIATLSGDDLTEAKVLAASGGQ